MNSLLIAQNIVKRAFRNKKELVILLALPIAAIFIMTFFTGGQGVKDISAGVLNRDKGIYGKELVGSINAVENVNIINLNEDEYKDAVKDGKADFAVVIPESFTSDMEKGKRISVEFISSGMSEISEKMKQDINQYVSDLYLIDSSASDISKSTGKEKMEVLDTLLNNTEDETLSSSFILAGGGNSDENRMGLMQSIGFAIMFIMIFIFITIGTMMEDKRKLTIARISTFQVKNWEIAAGNLLGSLILGIIQLVPVIAVLSIVYKLQSATEIAGMFLILLCFLAATIGLGLGISGHIKKDMNPALLIAVVIFPTSLLGGCLIPGSMLPSFMGSLGYAVPQKWVMTAVQKLVTGAGISGIAIDLVIILMFGLALAIFGVKTLKPMNE